MGKNESPDFPRANIDIAIITAEKTIIVFRDPLSLHERIGLAEKYDASYVGSPDVGVRAEWWHKVSQPPPDSIVEFSEN